MFFLSKNNILCGVTEGILFLIFLKCFYKKKKHYLLFLKFVCQKKL